jgi:hypothetical protein
MRAMREENRSSQSIARCNGHIDDRSRLASVGRAAAFKGGHPRQNGNRTARRLQTCAVGEEGVKNETRPYEAGDT